MNFSILSDKDFYIITNQNYYTSKVYIIQDTETHKFQLSTGHFFAYPVDQDIEININGKKNNTPTG